MGTVMMREAVTMIRAETADRMPHSRNRVCSWALQRAYTSDKSLTSTSLAGSLPATAATAPGAAFPFTALSAAPPSRSSVSSANK